MASSSSSEEYPPYTPIVDNGEAERVAFIPAPATARSQRDGFGPARRHSRNCLSPWFAPSSRMQKWTTSAMALYASNIGLLLVMLSQVFGSAMNTTVKVLNDLDPPVHPLELVTIRMIITYVFAVGYMYYAKVPHPVAGPPGVRLLLIVRGVSGFFGLFGMYFSLQYLTLSDAVVLTFLIPTTTAVVGYFLLGEGFSRKQAAAGLISLFGVILIARPSFLFGEQAAMAAPPDTAHGGVDGVAGPIGPAEKGTSAQRLLAVAVSLLGVLGATGAVTSLRAIGTRAHPLHSISFFALYSVVVSVAGIIIFRIPLVYPTSALWASLFLLLGACGFGAQITLTMGLQRETAGRAMLATYTQIVFAAAMERVFFRVYPSALSMMGIVVILGSAVYVAVSKETTTKKVGGLGGGAEALVVKELGAEAHAVGFDSDGDEESALGLEEVHHVSGEK